MIRNITERQERALASPCARAIDTAAEQFFAFVRHRGSVWSTILSVNK